MASFPGRDLSQRVTRSKVGKCFSSLNSLGATSRRNRSQYSAFGRRIHDSKLWTQGIKVVRVVKPNDSLDVFRELDGVTCGIDR